MTLDDKDAIEIALNKDSSSSGSNGGSMSEPSFNGEEEIKVEGELTIESTRPKGTVVGEGDIYGNPEDDDKEEIPSGRQEPEDEKEMVQNRENEPVSNEEPVEGESAPSEEQVNEDNGPGEESLENKLDEDSSKEEVVSGDDQGNEESVSEQPTEGTPGSSEPEDVGEKIEEPGKEDNSSKELSEEPFTESGSTKDNNEPVSETKSDDKEKSNSKEPKSDVEKGADKAKNAADNAKDKAEKAKEGAEKAKEGAEKAKDAADKAKDAADKAKDAADKAKNAANNAPKGNALDRAEDVKNIADKAKKEGVGKAATSAEAQRLVIDELAKKGVVWADIAKGIISLLDNLIGSDKVDKVFDKLGEQALKSIQFTIYSSLASLLLPVVLLVIMIYSIFAPLLENIERFDEGARKAANTVEKFKNLYINHTFADSKEAFYLELERLDKVYGDDLDETLLLATTFYPDMKNGYKTHYDSIGDIIDDVVVGGEGSDQVDLGTNTEDGQAYITTLEKIVKLEIESVLEESDATYDDASGLAYTTGKVYRLRNLADHMFASTFLGDEDDYNYRTMNLGDWIDRYIKDDDAYVKEMFDRVEEDILVTLGSATLGYATAATLPAVGVIIPDPIVATVSAIASIFVAVETSEKMARDVDDIARDVKLLINCLFLGYMSIRSITFSSGVDYTSWDSILEHCEIKYYTYKYSEENYRKYLKEIYIPSSPEYREYLSYDADGNPTESSIDKIINEIFEFKYYFEKIFYIEEEDESEGYSKLCLGAIDRKLASAMSLPVDISSGKCIEFLNNNAYGYTSSGLLHNGIELNEQSTGNKQGDAVYAVMDGGTVKSSSVDNTLTCNGGCIEIEYNYNTSAAVGGSTYNYSVIYKGMSKSSVTLKTGDTVTNHQQVGSIGTAEESEGVNLPSLYLEFRTGAGIAVDPTNMIVKCSSAGVMDYPGAKTYDVPQDFYQYPHAYSITCIGSDGWHYSGGESNNYKCHDYGSNVLSPSKEVHDVWVSQGARFKNGIGYVVVDGVERYLAAVVPTVAEAGDVVNATLKDGTIIPLLIMDTKGGDAEYEWGHAFGDGVDVIEFEVDTDTYNSKGNVSKSAWGIDWDQSSPVVKFSNNGSISSGKFDVPDRPVAGTSSGASPGSELELCDSMYSGGKVNLYVNKAIEIANDDSIGYSSKNRKMNPDVDNASFIYYSLVKGQIIPDREGPFLTNTMGIVLEENGFERMPYAENKLQKGDIVVDHDSGEDGYAVMYIGDGKQVSANPKEADDVAGDGNKKEVAVGAFVSDDRYHEIYRYNYEKQYGPINKGSSASIDTKPTANNEVITIEENSQRVGGEYVVVKTSYSGGVEGFTEMLRDNNVYQSSSSKKGDWGGCCGGMSQLHACGLKLGKKVTVGNVSSSCNDSNLSCSDSWGAEHQNFCFETEEDYVHKVIKEIQDGNPVITVVTVSSSNFGRHFVTIVGYKKDTNATSASDLLYIDSYYATLRTINLSRLASDKVETNNPCRNYNGDFFARPMTK
jgi:hypothetical protein